MSRKKHFLNLLIVAEAIVLAIVILGSFLLGNGFSFAGDSSENDSAVAGSEADSGTGDNAIGEASSPQTSDTGSEETEDSAAGSSEQNVEEKLSFTEDVQKKLDEMTTEEKVAQLFVTTPEELTGVDQVTVAGDSTKTALESYPIAGLIYSSQNFVGSDQIVSMLETTQGYIQDRISLNLFTIVEEVGGENHSPLAAAIAHEYADSPAELGEESNPSTIYAAAQTRAEYVLECGFNTILAPVADVATGSDEGFDEMTYGSDAVNVSECVEMDVEGVQDTGVMAVVRAFPGVSEVTEDYTVYQSAIDSGAECIQVSNLTSSSLTGSSSLPCSLSEDVAEKLRNEMGFEGILMTSDLSAASVQEYCSVSEAAVTALAAGMDVIYITDGFGEAYQAVLDAVNDGTISNTRLNNSAGRVISAKLD